MSGSRAGLDPPRCNSIERSFPFRSSVADPVIYITTVSGALCSPLKEISGRRRVGFGGRDKRKERVITHHGGLSESVGQESKRG